MPPCASRAGDTGAGMGPAQRAPCQQRGETQRMSIESRRAEKDQMPLSVQNRCPDFWCCLQQGLSAGPFGAAVVRAHLDRCLIRGDAVGLLASQRPARQLPPYVGKRLSHLTLQAQLFRVRPFAYMELCRTRDFSETRTSPSKRAQ